jgi:hypothetical protein
MLGVRVVLSKEGFLEDVVDAQGNPVDYQIEEHKGCEIEHESDALWFSDQELQSEALVQCAKCHKTSKEVELKRCTRCSASKSLESSILYCSTECQTADWEEKHQSECNLLAEEPPRPVAAPRRGPGRPGRRYGYHGRHRHYPGYRGRYGYYPWAYPGLFPWYSYWYRRPYYLARDAFLPDLSDNKFDQEKTNYRDVDRKLSELRATYSDVIAKNFEIVPSYPDGTFIWVKESQE